MTIKGFDWVVVTLCAVVACVGLWVVFGWDASAHYIEGTLLSNLAGVLYAWADRWTRRRSVPAKRVDKRRKP